MWWNRGSRPKGKICPLIGEGCIKHDCEFYQNILGSDPQTGEPINTFRCLVGLLPTLLIDLSRQTYSVGAAIENRGNKTIEELEHIKNMSVALVQKRVLNESYMELEQLNASLVTDSESRLLEGAINNEAEG